MTLQYDVFPPPEFGAIQLSVVRPPLARYARLISNVLVIPCGLAITIATLFYVLWIELPDSSEMLNIFSLFVIGVFSFFGGIWNVVQVTNNWNQAVYVCEKGLAFRENKLQILMPWANISTLRAFVTRIYSYGVNTGTRYQYWIVDNYGQLVFLDNKLPLAVEQVYETVRERTFLHRLAVVQAELAKGRAVDFGSLSLSSQAFSNKKTTFLVSDIQHLEAKNGELVVKFVSGNFAGRQMKFAFRQIENADVFWALLHSFWQGATKKD